MNIEQEFESLMQRLREGSQEAGRELFELYGPHILYVVRRRLTSKLRSQFDSMDFTQAVWASFFALPQANYSFSSPKELMSFLITMARNKVIDSIRQRLVFAKRNVTRTQSMERSVTEEA